MQKISATVCGKYVYYLLTSYIITLLVTLNSDCTAPFSVDIFTDTLDDLGMDGANAMANAMHSRGKFIGK